MNKVISKALCKYENLIVIGDFKIDIKISSSERDSLENICDLFNLANLVHSETCFMKKSKSIIDLILTYCKTPKISPPEHKSPPKKIPCISKFIFYREHKSLHKVE